MKKWIGSLFCLLLVVASTSARAEIGEPGSWELGPYFGAKFPDKYNGFEPDNGVIAGLRVGYNFTRHFSLEPSFQHSSGESAGVEMDFDAIRLNALWTFIPGEFARPFVTAGAGWERADMPGALPHENTFAPNLGAGFKLEIGPHGGVRFDGRYVPTKYSGPIDGWQHDFEGMVGLYLVLGPCKSKEVPAAAPAPAPTPAPAPAKKVDGDGDGDGVLDSKDKCPTTPKGTKVDEMGCQLESKARGVLKGVTFKTNSDELTEGSKARLDEVAATLAAEPGVQVEVGGHTDSVGDETYNRLLSEKRAKAVVKYLVGKGANEERFSAKGYGEASPISDNGTPAGRETNRRVEITWLN